MSGLPCSISEHGHHAGAFTTSSGKTYIPIRISMKEYQRVIERLQHILVTPFNIVLQDQKNIIPNVLPLPPSTASTSVPNSVQPSTVTTNTNIQQQPATSGRIVCQPCVGQPTPPHVQQVRLPAFSYRNYFLIDIFSTLIRYIMGHHVISFYYRLFNKQCNNINSNNNKIYSSNNNNNNSNNNNNNTMIRRLIYNNACRKQP